ncbi:hypothetical protein NW828_13490, partial [Synechococcus sp. W55.2]
MNSQSQDRLDRVEQLLAWTAEQTAANSREIRELCQSIQELRQSIQESRTQSAEGTPPVCGKSRSCVSPS